MFLPKGKNFSGTRMNDIKRKFYLIALIYIYISPTWAEETNIIGEGLPVVLLSSEQRSVLLEENSTVSVLDALLNP